MNKATHYTNTLSALLLFVFKRPNNQVNSKPHCLLLCSHCWPLMEDNPYHLRDKSISYVDSNAGDYLWTLSGILHVNRCCGLIHSSKFLLKRIESLLLHMYFCLKVFNSIYKSIDENEFLLPSHCILQSLSSWILILDALCLSMRR